jgi:hypothetical protein
MILGLCNDRNLFNYSVVYSKLYSYIASLIEKLIFCKTCFILKGGIFPSIKLTCCFK